VDSEPLADPVWGRSGLTDAERSLLAYVTLRHAADELATYQGHVVEQREADDAIEQEHERLLAEARAASRAGRGPTLSRQALDTARAFRSAIYAKNPAPIEVYSDLPDEWPDYLPEPVQGRVGRVQVHTRDTLKTTATQAMGVDVYSRIVQHMVETSSLMAAGATVITTATGEDLVVPKSTGFVTTNIFGEGVSITESDPTLSTVTLKAFKYANYFEISQELANDTPTNLLDFLARQAALSLGLGATGYGNDLINGVGTTAPRGLLLDAATGVTGPAGTGTTRTPTSGCCSSAPTTRRSPRNACTWTWKPTMLRPRSKRLEALGATRYDHQQERGFDFWVMRDPWGNEFCVLQPNFPELLARRRPWPT
jgi:HK97 family phage major capsid protein